MTDSIDNIPKGDPSAAGKPDANFPEPGDRWMSVAEMRQLVRAPWWQRGWWRVLAWVGR